MAKYMKDGSCLEKSLSSICGSIASYHGNFKNRTHPILGVEQGSMTGCRGVGP